MDFKIKKRITYALRQMLGAIVRLALRNGMNFVELSDVIKSLYVEISANEYGIRGRPTNDARIALITGLARREVKKIREDNNSDGNGTTKASPDRMGKILYAWHHDSKYLDKNQQPLLLKLEGDSPSFADLVSQYGGDFAMVTVLREFKRSKIVEEGADGLLRVLKTQYIPNYFNDSNREPDFVDPEAINHGSSMLVDHINTIFFNLYRKETNRNARMELRATNELVDKSQVSAFYKFADELSLEYLEKIDNWLSEHTVTDARSAERVGVGLYFIEGPNKTVGVK